MSTLGTEPSADATNTPDAPLSPAAKEALLEGWRDVLNGTKQPEIISVPAEVERIVEEEIRRLPGRPSASAVARLRLEQFLEHAYPGQTVLCMETPAGTAVLAAGEEEVALFWRTYPREVGVRVDVHYPPMS